MTSTTPLHGDHQLDQLAAQFAHWRQTRTHPSERIPHELWDRAVAVAATLPPSRVAKQVRIRLMDLKKRMATQYEGTPPGSPLSLGFVEVPSAPTSPPPAVVTQIELSRADGTRLCMHTPMAPPALEALVRAFVEGRSCCSSPRKAASLSPQHRWICAKGSLGSPPCVGRYSATPP